MVMTTCLIAATGIDAACCAMNDRGHDRSGRPRGARRAPRCSSPRGSPRHGAVWRPRLRGRAAVLHVLHRAGASASGAWRGPRRHRLFRLGAIAADAEVRLGAAARSLRHSRLRAFLRPAARLDDAGAAWHLHLARRHGADRQRRQPCAHRAVRRAAGVLDDHAGNCRRRLAYRAVPDAGRTRPDRRGEPVGLSRRDGRGGQRRAAAGRLGRLDDRLSRHCGGRLPPIPDPRCHARRYGCGA